MPVVIAHKAAGEILHAIIGTAGHVDHGKTSLVKLLTGCNTDHLPEEQARGMSIDLGFAPCTLSLPGASVTVGLVDVPGHRDFIRNMVAGASSIDILLLVIAADDGPMPQTLEHLQIIALLRAPQLIVALTKTDLVAPERLAEARAEISALLERFGFTGAPIVPVSNKTGEGIGEILAALAQAAAAARQPSADARAFRMNVERVFSVKGYGTVATGIPMSGRERVGAELELLPGRRRVTVRAIQRYKQASDVASAACCCALNIHDIAAADVARGMTLAAPGVYGPVTEFLATLENVSDAVTLARRSDAFVHSGTAAVQATVKLLESESLPPGGRGFAQVILQEPMTLAAGDRFIIRSLTPPATLGGGVVLSVRPQRLRRHERIGARLAAAADAARAGRLLACEALAGPGAVLATAEAARLTQCADAAAQKAALAQLAGRATDLGGGYLLEHRAAELAAAVGRVLETFHRENPLLAGMPPAELCGALEFPATCAAGLTKVLSARRVVVERAGRLASPTFQPAVNARLQELFIRALGLVTAAGVNGVARGNLAKDLAASDSDVAALVRLLSPQHAVILEGNLVLRAAHAICRAQLQALLAREGKVSLASFRAATSTSRKIAVAMLDAFDAEGLTRRAGDFRVGKPGNAER